jgi:glycine cleavage system regulatory protein
MTLIGIDRPGLVESLAEIVAKHDANWLDSRMSHLAGQFAGILQVDVAGDRVESLVAALTRLDQQGLTVIVQTDSGPAVSKREADFSAVEMDLLGNDHPGIVREVSHVLAELKVNVEDIHTECKTAPMSGGKLFHARAKLRLPNDLTLGDLRDRLEQIAHDMMVDICIRESD